MAASKSMNKDESEVQEAPDSSHQPATGFTAVNGRTSPTAPAKSKPDQQHSRDSGPEVMSSERESHAQGDASQQRDDRRSKTLSDGKQSPTTTPPQGPIRDATNEPPTFSNPAPLPQHHHHHLHHHHMTNGHRADGHDQRNDGAGTSPIKRKRSPSQERHGRDGPIYPGNGPSPKSGPRINTENAEARASDPWGTSDYSPPHEGYPPPHDDPYPPISRHAYPPPPGEHNGPAEAYPMRDRHSGPRNGYEHPADPSMNPNAPPGYYSSEAHLADALQRENRGYDEHRGGYGGSPEDEEDDQQGTYPAYGDSRDGNSGNEADRRKRKRVFSNRTKTGCMTCRRRKKKCDEQHPECNNCLRGGFVCEGYNVRNTWQKPANAKQPVPLQSKNGYPPQNAPPRQQYPAVPRGYDPGPEYQGPPPHHRGSYDAGRSAPPPMEDDRDQMYARSDPQMKPQSVWSKAARPYPSNPPQASEYQGKVEPHGSIYDIPETTDPYAHRPLPRDGDRRLSTVSQYPVSRRASAQAHSSVQAAAQAALVHTASLRPSREPQSGAPEDTDRQKMLKGVYYFPSAAALVADREQCIQAIWRFNNATNPSHGVSIEERGRLFRQIMQLRPTPETQPLPNGNPAPKGQHPGDAELPTGSVGNNVVVEAPFHCDYGYNITIRDDVFISADCRITDCCAVTIGARVIFSPNVRLVCSTYPIDPRRRTGSKGPALARAIVIEDDCWIGPDVTILAGVRVGRSSTIGAGSLLHADVAAFTVVAGNLGRITRDVYDNTGGSVR